MARRLTTAKKVSIGFALMALFLLVSVSLTIWQNSRTERVTHQLVNQSGPMIEAALRIINGVSDAAGKARGWMLVNDERLKIGWAAAYSEWVEPGVTKLKTLANESGDRTSIERVRFVEGKVKELKQFQERQISLVRMDKNLPAHELMQSRAVPQAEEIIKNLRIMADEEQRSPQTSDRKSLAGHIAEFRSSFGDLLASGHAFLYLGTDAAGRRLQQDMQRNAQDMATLEEQSSTMQGTEAQVWKRTMPLLADFDATMKSVVDLRSSAQWDLAVAILRENAVPCAREIQTTLQELILSLEPVNKANRESLTEMIARLSMLEWWLLVAGLLVAGVLSLVIVRNINESIRTVHGSVLQIRTASQGIAAGAQQQVAGLNETATSLNEITTTAEEFKVTMQEFADRARAVQEAADETAARSTEGRSLTQDSVARIEQVRANAQAAGESAQRMAEQMQRIGEITATVHEIAEQTKMLALNASIEAARAGEQGAGFAVVATHVRELANQSKEAAGRIESLVTNTHKSVQDVVDKIEDGARMSGETTQMTREMSSSFEEIAQAIKQTTDAMAQINIGARQQERGIAELVSSITEIDAASKESLASAEQTQQAIVSIDEQIRRLNQVMEAF